MALAISRPLGLTTAARYSAIGVMASATPPASRGAPRQRRSEVMARASMAAESAPLTRRAA